MGQSTTALTFSEWLRAQLDERGWGVRTLARMIDPENPEIPRRAINRYLHEGAQPTEPYAMAIADAFEVDRSDLPTEEAAPMGGQFRKSDRRGPDGGPSRAHRAANDSQGAGGASGNGEVAA